MYISLSDLRIELKKDLDKLELEVDLHSFQIDNMMPHTAFPIVIHPQIEEGQPMLKLMLVRMENTAGLQHFKTLQVQLQPISINVELALLAFLIGEWSPGTDDPDVATLVFVFWNISDPCRCGGSQNSGAQSCRRRTLCRPRMRLGLLSRRPAR